VDPDFQIDAHVAQVLLALGGYLLAILQARCSDCSNTNGPAVSVASDTPGAFVVGGGIEYAWAPNWSVRLEYDFIGAPDQILALTAVNEPTFTETLRENIQMVTFGVNYRFG
jgi:outer membrane immunogenic protein